MIATIKYVFFFVLIVAMFAAYADAKCIDEHGEHCKVFAPFCNDARYVDIASKCAQTCGKC